MIPGEFTDPLNIFKEANSKVLVTTSIEEHRLGFPKIGRDSRFDFRSPSYGARKVADFYHLKTKSGSRFTG